MHVSVIQLLAISLLVIGTVIVVSRSKKSVVVGAVRIVGSLLLAFLAFGAVGGYAAAFIGADLAIGVGSIAGLGVLVAAWVSFFYKKSNVADRAAPSALVPQPPPDQRQQAATIAPIAAPDVFISYKREEREIVEIIAHRLEALKVKVWFDAELRSGTSFDSEIDRQVRAAKCVLVCWSPGATASDWVRGEATIGRQRGVLAAALLKPCDLPSPFNLVHAEDLSGGIDQRPLEWQRLLERIGPLVGRSGLAEYVRLESAPVATELALWMARNPGDALFDLAAARLKASQT